MPGLLLMDSARGGLVVGVWDSSKASSAPTTGDGVGTGEIGVGEASSHSSRPSRLSSPSIAATRSRTEFLEGKRRSLSGIRGSGRRRDDDDDALGGVGTPLGTPLGTPPGCGDPLNSESDRRRRPNASASSTPPSPRDDGGDSAAAPVRLSLFSSASTRVAAAASGLESFPPKRDRRELRLRDDDDYRVPRLSSSDELDDAGPLPRGVSSSSSSSDEKSEEPIENESES